MYTDRAGNQERSPSDREINRHVGARLRQLRAHRGIRMVDVAGAIGVLKQQVQKYETGVSRLYAARLLRAARVLGCSVDDFFLGLPGAEDPGHDERRALRALRGYVARWGLDHPDLKAQDEAREVLGLDDGL